MSMSYSATELSFTSGEYSFWESLEAQAATQGQTIFISAGDAGSDDKDQGTSGTATSGINVSGNSSNLVTVAGGTDFSDYYDAHEGGVAESTYWSATNTADYGSALGYIPETTWNGNCASSIGAVFVGEATIADNCAADGSGNDGRVAGGSGGISTHYAVPAWQTGISGYSNAYRSSPDISGFASNGVWGHSLASCDSNSNSPCWELSGGTSFVSPYLAGVAGLLVTYTGSRQGFLNPALYALAKAQYTNPATATACYSNGQTSNTGVTTGLPAASCIFNDVTTSNNDVPCAAGSTDCYINSGAAYGLLSLNGATSLEVAYPSTIGFDTATGLGSVNVNNLITKWNTAFGSTTALSASLTSLTSSQSTSLTATVTGKTPTGYVDTPPALTGTATFKGGTTVLGNCTLSAGTCKLTVAGSALQSGANSVTATFTGSKTYPASTSSIVTVTVTGGSSAAVLTSPTPGSTLAGLSALPSAGRLRTNATGYGLWIGSSATNADNLYYSGEKASTVTSLTVSGLPVNGETIYVRLITYYGSSSSFTLTPIRRIDGRDTDDAGAWQHAGGIQRYIQLDGWYWRDWVCSLDWQLSNGCGQSLLLGREGANSHLADC
jgi:subtilase family serine protease